MHVASPHSLRVSVSVSVSAVRGREQAKVFLGTGTVDDLTQKRLNCLARQASVAGRKSVSPVPSEAEKEVAGMRPVR